MSDVSSNPNANEFANNTYIGDRSGLVVSETSVYPLWTDFRNGTQDIFGARLPLDPNALQLGLGIGAIRVYPARGIDATPVPVYDRP